MQIDQKLLKKVSSGKGCEADIAAIYMKSSGADSPDAQPFRVDMAQRAAEFGYFKWPVTIRDHIGGKRVLDVGCGSGIDSIGFVTLGAREYVGIDRGMKLDSSKVKNKNAARLKGGLTPKESFGWTPNDISLAFPQITFFRGTFEELRAQRGFSKFDVITMHTVTEHLMQIEEVFAGCEALLANGGKFIYLHHNFYGWNGHHMPPKRVEDVDESDPDQLHYLDWRHITFDAPEDHYFHSGLNKIRLDDLKALTEKYFKIIEWRERMDDRGRLTQEIRNRLSQYSERELATDKVFCLALKR